MVSILQSWMRKDGKRIMAKKKAVRRENGIIVTKSSKSTYNTSERDIEKVICKCYNRECNFSIRLDNYEMK